MKTLKILFVSLFVSFSTHAHPFNMTHIVDEIMKDIVLRKTYSVSDMANIAFRHSLVNSYTEYNRPNMGMERDLFMQTINIMFRTLLNHLGEMIVRNAVGDFIENPHCSRLSSHLLYSLLFHEKEPMPLAKSFLYFMRYGEEDVMKCFFK